MYINGNNTDLDHAFPFQMDVVTLSARDNVSGTFHWHNGYGVALILDGAGCYYVNGKAFTAAAEDIVIVNNAELHGWQVFEREMRVLAMFFSSELIAPFGVSSGMDFIKPFIESGTSFKNFIGSTEPCAEEIAKSMREIQVEWKERRTCYPLMIWTDVMRILTLLMRYYPDETRAETDINRNKALVRLQPAFEYIDSNYCGKITLKEAADRVYMSPNYFSRFFHVFSGISFSDYVTMRRLGKAWGLLETTSKSIFEISIECGFPNSSNFYRLFKKCTGKSPRKNRKTVLDSLTI